MQRLIRPWAGLTRLPRPIWILCSASLVNRVGTMALPFLVLYLTSARQWPASQAGLMLTVFGGCSLVTSPIAGRLTDRFGPVRLMEGSLLGTGLALLVFPWMRSPATIVAATAAWAITAECFRPASMVVLTELAPPHLRKQAFALHRLAINLGMSVGPAVGGFLAQRSFPAVFRVDGASTLLALGLLMGAGFAVTRTERDPRAELSAAALTDGRLRYALLAVLPAAIVFFQLESAIPLYLVHDLGLSPAVYGSIFTLNTLMIVTMEIPLNALTADWSARRTLALGSALATVGISAMGLAHGTFGVMVATVIFTFGEMTLFPGMSAYIAEIAPADRRGEYMGLYTMTYSVAMAIGPWLGTVVLEGQGAGTLWTGTLVLGLCGSAAFARMPSGAALLDGAAPATEA